MSEKRFFLISGSISRAYKFIGKIFGGSARTVINQNWLTVNHFSANGSYFIWGKQRWKAEMKILQWSLQALLFLCPLWLCLLLTHSLVQNGESTCRHNSQDLCLGCLMGKLRVFLQMFLLPCNILLIDKQICLSVIEYVCLFIHILYFRFFSLWFWGFVFGGDFSQV